MAATKPLTDFTSAAAQNRNQVPAFPPGSETPVGASLELPSRRGFGKGPTVTGDQAPGADQYFARAQAMHAARADVADRRAERAADQRASRRERRRRD